MLFPILTIRTAKRFTDTTIVVVDRKIGRIDRKIDRLDAKRAQMLDYRVWAVEASSAYAEFLSAVEDADTSRALNVGRAAKVLATTLPEPPSIKVVHFGRRVVSAA